MELVRYDYEELVNNFIYQFSEGDVKFPDEINDFLFNIIDELAKRLNVHELVTMCEKHELIRELSDASSCCEENYPVPRSFYNSEIDVFKQTTNPLDVSISIPYIRRGVAHLDRHWIMFTLRECLKSIHELLLDYINKSIPVTDTIDIPNNLFYDPGSFSYSSQQTSINQLYNHMFFKILRAWDGSAVVVGSEFVMNMFGMFMRSVGYTLLDYDDNSQRTFVDDNGRLLKFLSNGGRYGQPSEVVTFGTLKWDNDSRSFLPSKSMKCHLEADYDFYGGDMIFKLKGRVGRNYDPLVVQDYKKIVLNYNW